jgi:hypothetical protein
MTAQWIKNIYYKLKPGFGCVYCDNITEELTKNSKNKSFVFNNFNDRKDLFFGAKRCRITFNAENYFGPICENSENTKIVFNKYNLGRSIGYNSKNMELIFKCKNEGKKIGDQSRDSKVIFQETNFGIYIGSSSVYSSFLFEKGNEGHFIGSYSQHSKFHFNGINFGSNIGSNALGIEAIFYSDNFGLLTGKDSENSIYFFRKNSVGDQIGKGAKNSIFIFNHLNSEKIDADDSNLIYYANLARNNKSKDKNCIKLPIGIINLGKNSYYNDNFFVQVSKYNISFLDELRLKSVLENNKDLFVLKMDSEGNFVRDNALKMLDEKFSLDGSKIGKNDEKLKIFL